MNKVTVIGSINVDHAIRTPRMPKGGETIHTNEVFTTGGGKGANQAVAATRLGAKTAFIGAVGSDDAGEMMLSLLREEEIDTSCIATLDDTVTGQAFVIVDDNSENRILVHGGANMALTPDVVASHRNMIETSDFVVSQFETPFSCTKKAFELAHQANITTILNPAPAMTEVPESLLKETDIIIPNETEAAILTGIEVVDEESMKACAEALHNKGIETVIITLGSRGAYFSQHGQTGIVPAFKVDARDTTAAGDTFIGALVSQLHPSLDNLEEAIRYGNKASSLAVQRFGAQPSIPFIEEMNEQSN